MTLDGLETTGQVSAFAPDNFGLYDMIGNKCEPTDEWYDAMAFMRA